MKSIKQQYIDLREGNMTQANFMRNLRMTLPQYVTNLSSFEDSLRILKNKGILTEADIKMAEPEEETLPKITPEEEETDNEETADDVEVSFDVSTGGITANNDDYHRDGFTMGYFEESLNEAKDEKGKWTNADGKSMYDQFKEINLLNAQEVLIGIDYEMQKNKELTKAEAQKIVIKNLKKNPIYYTAEDMSGVEGYEPEYMGGKSAQPEARQMQYLDKNMGNVVDKKMGMQPVKGVEKAKKDSDKGGETNKAVKGIDLMSLIAKTVRGMKKMDATGEKMKKVSVKENYEKVNLNNPKMSDQAARAKKIYDEEEARKNAKNAELNTSAAEREKKDAEKASKDRETQLKAAKGDTMDAALASFPGLRERLKDIIRKEIQEMYDGMELMDRPYPHDEQTQINELDFNQIAMGNNQPSQPKASFEGKWTDIKDKNEFINKFRISNTSPLVDIVARAIGSNSNYAITNKDGKFYVYTFTQTANPGKPSQAFNSLEDAKKSVKL
jgi:hypothetical protein